MTVPVSEERVKVSPLYDPKIRGIVFQVVLTAIILFVLYEALTNASENLAKAKIASGGELSRVMLAVEVVFAGSESVPTLVFDEVDAGVGGGIAEVIGRKLADVARRLQREERRAVQERERQQRDTEQDFRHRHRRQHQERQEARSPAM